MSPKTDTYKPTLLAGRNAKKSSGLGAKKAGGLGAQKVKANFNDIESAALQKEKDSAAASLSAISGGGGSSVKGGGVTGGGGQKITSMNLAYNELSLDEKKREEKMKNMDPKKREQVRILLSVFFNWSLLII